ncbi:hypothetical protein ABZ942_33780 [Nocardia sp. NPDC046473]|uniref:hypothetical protein n=1 Tax=Nocardia sp. NPDC046473 TaxID=3155733 RepID=UPI0033D8EBF8
MTAVVLYPQVEMLAARGGGLTMETVRFDSLLEIETAFRAMVMFKFSGSGEAEIFLGSPVMASALESMLAAIVDGWNAAGYAGKATGWRDWYALSHVKSRDEQISKYLVTHPKWGSLSRTDRLDWLRVVAAPYWLDEAGVARFDPLIGETQPLA